MAEAITGALTIISTLITQVLTMIMENEYCMIYLAAGLVFLGMKVFKKAKNTAK